jgi:glycerate kinase
MDYQLDCPVVHPAKGVSMKIVIAMDSFKGTLASTQACTIISDVIRETCPGVHVVVKPMADGGEGTARAMILAGGGRWIPRTVTGPLTDMKVEAGFAWFDEDKTALVEMASASGIELLKSDQLNPMKTTTYGTGELVRAAGEYGARKILLAVGGSATVDGGIGAAAALGWQFLDKDGRAVPLGGAGLAQINNIIAPKTLNLPPVEILCDVDNPLCGSEGAARVYGPQKGATPEMVEHLDKGLAHLAECVKAQLGRDIKDVLGAGAAGGLAAGAMAFMNGAIVSGIDAVMKRSKIEDELTDADWVITGEGSFDEQSLRGKVVSGLCKLARKFDVPIAVIAGQVTVEKKKYQKVGIATAIACRQDGVSLDYAMKNSRAMLRGAAQKLVSDCLIRRG